ncbi:putative PH-like domain superfamily, NECAP, PHear domain-containing protein [Helianthus anomalus]
MSFELEEEDAFEHTLLVVREVSMFKIPSRSTSGGYKCGQWLQSDRLEDPNSGDLFAACFMHPGQRENAVESVLDSSRYFVLQELRLVSNNKPNVMFQKVNNKIFGLQNDFNTFIWITTFTLKHD